MNINCPVCRGIRMDFEYPKHYDAYHKLIFKIHEKIEEYTYDTAIGRVCKKELKSLLEDEE